MDNARHGQICPGNWLAVYKKLPPAIIMDYLLFPIFLMCHRLMGFIEGDAGDHPILDHLANGIRSDVT